MTGFPGISPPSVARIRPPTTRRDHPNPAAAVIPRSVRVAEAPSHGVPVTHYDRRSRGAEAYWKVAMELVERR